MPHRPRQGREGKTRMTILSSARGCDTATARRLLSRLLMPNPPPFALLRRSGSADGLVEVLVGELAELSSLADLPLPEANGGQATAVLAVIPYRQVTERGYACHDDGEPILTLTSTGSAALPAAAALALLPDVEVNVRDGAFDIADQDYERIVERIVGEEIRAGEGSNFVIRRSFRATLTNFRHEVAMTVFRRLLTAESNAYWTFVVHLGDRTFVGASPEQHVRVTEGVARMNPISGTYRYPPSGPDLGGVLDFLADQKETDELYMVLDEELKMLARVCDRGARVRGPYLREMAKLAHTEYALHGDSSMDVREVLRETLFAPTVIGSPLENACRVITRHEPDGRGYYGGAVALLGRDSAGRPTLDSAILIRAAEIRPPGTLRVDVGATLVRHSQPAAEVAETWTKVEALLGAIGVPPRPEAAGERSGVPAAAPGLIAQHPEVVAALQRRNVGLSSFWLAQDGPPSQPRDHPATGGVLIIDAEDLFTGMLGHQVRALGQDVTIAPVMAVTRQRAAAFDCVLLGPGPGDPRDRADPRIARLRGLIDFLLAQGIPFVAECLSHQVLADTLGLELFRRSTPNQGTQRELSLFGRAELVGFYNSFAARQHATRWPAAASGREIEVCQDHQTGEVHALRGRGFASTQFHLESVLTRRGTRILADLLSWAVGPDYVSRRAALSDRAAG